MVVAGLAPASTAPEDNESHRESHREGSPDKLERTDTERDRHLSEDPEFNSFEFKRKYVTYEEKERAVNRLADMFGEQKSQYHQERKVVTDNVVLLLVNMGHYYEMRTRDYPAIIIDPASGRNQGWCPPFLDLKTKPRNPFLVNDQAGADLDKCQKDMIDALAIDASEMKEELESIGSSGKYDVTKFEKDLLKMAVGSDVIDLATGSVRGVIDAGLQGKSISDLTREAGRGAFNVAASEDKTCDKGQFVYVNGTKVCIPFKVTYEHDDFIKALGKLTMSADATREQAAFDKYTQLLDPRSSDDISDPNIRKLDSKYKGRIDELYRSYLKHLKALFHKVETRSDCDGVLPILDIYLDFFEGLDTTDISYEQKLREMTDAAIYGSTEDHPDMKANRVLTSYALRLYQYSRGMTDTEY